MSGFFGIKCKLGLCGGDAVSGWHSSGALYMAFRCRECGKISQEAPSMFGPNIDPDRVAIQREFSKSTGDPCYYEPDEIFAPPPPGTDR